MFIYTASRRTAERKGKENSALAIIATKAESITLWARALTSLDKDFIVHYAHTGAISRIQRRLQMDNPNDLEKSLMKKLHEAVQKHQKTEASTHTAVVTLVTTINEALDSLMVGESRRAVLLLNRALGTFSDSRFASNQEVSQLFEPFMAVVTVCAAKGSQDDGAAMRLFADAVRVKLNRIRP